MNFFNFSANEKRPETPHIEFRVAVGHMSATMSRKACFRTQVAAVLLIASISALSAPAFARSADEKKWRKACTADAFSLCPLQSVTGNRNGVRDCLLKKFDKVSDPCVAVIRAALLPQPQLTATLPSTTH